MKITTKINQRLTEMMTNLADFVGRPIVFVSALLLLVVWFVLRSVIEYDTWFDIMDVSIFIITFLLLFIVQASQNADTRAMQDKLDDIIDALPKADKSREGEEQSLKKGRKPGK